MVKPFGFPPSIRLRRKTDIDPVFRQGQYHRLGWLQARTWPNGREASRFMISVSRRAGTAPGRNRVKRVVREAVRLNRSGLATPHDVCLFVTKRPPRGVRLADAERELRRLFGRLAPQPHARVSDR
ncbi:MAG TPA: ribonuclease P protein component [bacterium]|nr:ribonuclease P protein component [bacterium]